MRRLLGPLAIGLAWVFATAGFIQVQAQGLGCKTGLVISDEVDGHDAQKNLTLGLLANFPLERGRFVPSVSIIPKGSQGSDDPWYVSVQSDLHVTFPFGSASFYFLVAPRVDFLIAVDGENGSIRYEDQYYFAELLPYNSVVWGGAIGVGQDIQMSTHTFFLEVRYDRDLTPAREIHSGGMASGESVVYNIESVLNRTLMLQIGVRWGEVKRDDRATSETRWPPIRPLY